LLRKTVNQIEVNGYPGIFLRLRKNCFVLTVVLCSYHFYNFSFFCSQMQYENFDEIKKNDNKIVRTGITYSSV